MRASNHTGKGRRKVQAYSIRPEIIARIEAIADHFEVSRSMVVEQLLLDGLRVFAGEIANAPSLAKRQIESGGGGIQTLGTLSGARNLGEK